MRKLEYNSVVAKIATTRKIRIVQQEETREMLRLGDA